MMGDLAIYTIIEFSIGFIAGFLACIMILLIKH